MERHHKSTASTQKCQNTNCFPVCNQPSLCGCGGVQRARQAHYFPITTARWEAGRKQCPWELLCQFIHYEQSGIKLTEHITISKSRALLVGVYMVLHHLLWSVEVWEAVPRQWHSFSFHEHSYSTHFQGWPSASLWLAIGWWQEFCSL